MPKPNPRVLSLLLLLALLGAAVLSVCLVAPPAAKPADAPATEFSAIRAMEQVRVIASEPHAVSTPAHASVRNYLLQEMQELGLNPQVQEATAMREVGPACFGGYVYNILGRLKGKENGKAVLLVAHYDSQPSTPGAGDDAAGVAAVLETARALQEGDPLQNDVIFLLTDGEEYGLLGAKGFLQHPWVREVGFVINLEGRGNSGPSATFEISPENGWVVKEYAKAAPYPLAASLMYEAYKRMPNDTDFSVFREEGIAGVNSAFIDGFVNYHSMTDTPENLDVNSLQHHGSNMLALTRHFGNIPLEDTKAPDRVFFNPVGKWLVQYKVGLNLLWAGIVTLLLVVTWAVGTKRKAFSGVQVIAGTLIFLVLLSIVTALFIPINRIVLNAMPFHVGSGSYQPTLFFLAYAALSIGLFLLLSRIALVWLKPFAMAMGACVVWFLLLIAALVEVPATAYVFLFPLLFCLAGLLLVLNTGLFEKPANGWYGLVLWLTALPAVFLLVPILYLYLFIIFELNLPIAMVATLVLLLGLLFPLLLLIEQGFRLRRIPVLPLVLLALGTGLVFWAISKEQPSAEQPFRTHISYYLNKDNNTALWASNNKQHDEWTQQFFSKGDSVGTLVSLFPHASIKYSLSKATALPLEGPQVSVIQDSTAAESRYLQLHLSSPRKAQHLELVLQPQDTTTIESIKLNGQLCNAKPIATPEGPIYLIRLYGLPVSKDAALELKAAAGKALRLITYDHSLGLPKELLPVPMPAGVVPIQGGTSNVTVVRKSYEL